MRTMADQLTDLPGIGPKTAESLKKDGITTPRELARAYRDGKRSVGEQSERVRKAARGEAIDRFGSFYDPFARVVVSESNKPAIEKFESTDTTDLNDAGAITRNDSSIQGTNLLDLGRKAVVGAGLVSGMRSTPTRGELENTVVGATSTPDGVRSVSDRDKKEAEQTRRNIAEMGFDVAANLAGVDRETVKEANEKRNKVDSGRKNPKSGFTVQRTRNLAGSESTFERDLRVNSREYAAAKRVQQARSPMAKRTDNRRRAETVTSDFDRWVKKPSQVDYPDVDTPKRGREAGSSFGFTANDSEFRADVDRNGGFTLREASTDGGGGFGRIERDAGEILSAPQEQQQLILGDLLPDEDEQERIGLEPKGPDKELFNTGEALGAFDDGTDNDGFEELL